MTSRAIQNARDNGIGNAHFLQVDLSNPLPADLGSHSLALLDPPRDGALEVVGNSAAWVSGDWSMSPAIRPPWRGTRESWSDRAIA